MCLLGVFLFEKNALAFESSEAEYRDFSEPRFNPNESCGSLCLQDVNYISRLQMESDFSRRGVYESPINSYSISTTSDSYSNKPYMSLSFNANSRVSRSAVQRRVRWATMARRVGVGVAERGRSFRSALWREARRPLLTHVRKRVLRPYRNKKLSTEEKLEAWVIEQSVESGADALDLEATSTIDFESDNLDFGISDYSLKYRPKVDPLKGRYGLRIRYKKHLSSRRPFYAKFSYYYCNSSLALRSGRCGYLHELSGKISTMTMKKRLQWSLFVSYQTHSLDDDAYIRDGEAFDHKPWLGGIQLTYAFFR